MKFVKDVEIKIIKTKYKITLSRGTARSLKKALTNVPDEAILVDEEGEDGYLILVFQNEIEEK